MSERFLLVKVAFRERLQQRGYVCDSCGMSNIGKKRLIVQTELPRNGDEPKVFVQMECQSHEGGDLNV